MKYIFLYLGELLERYEEHFGLKSMRYTRTEELIFAISLFSDFKQIFPVFKPQLLRLLGKEQNMPILGNTGILNWMITAMQSANTLLKSKDTETGFPSGFSLNSRRFSLLPIL